MGQEEQGIGRDRGKFARVCIYTHIYTHTLTYSLSLSFCDVGRRHRQGVLAQRQVPGRAGGNQGSDRLLHLGEDAQELRPRARGGPRQGGAQPLRPDAGPDHLPLAGRQGRGHPPAAAAAVCVDLEWEWDGERQGMGWL